MELEVLKRLHSDLNVFKQNKCTGCETCNSTNPICLEIIELRMKICKRIKEVENETYIRR